MDIIKVQEKRESGISLHPMKKIEGRFQCPSATRLSLSAQ